MKILTKIPHTVGVAFSGGVDSLAIAHFLQRGKRDVTLFHFNHGCQYSDQIQKECEDIANSLNLPIIIEKIDSDIPEKGSLEDFWRRARYRFLRAQNMPIITGHHLDDSCEFWIFSSLHGNGKLIPVISGNNIIRPFLTTEKQEFIDYANRHGLKPVRDEYNFDQHLMRNYMRVNMMEHCYHVNPGLKKVIRKKYLRDFK